MEGVFITNCVIDGFKIGIELGGKGSHSVAKTVVINSKSIGISITTDFNFLTGTIATKNAGVGIQIKGDLNSLDQCLAVENGKAGFSVQGVENSITGSVGILNGAEGLLGNARTSLISGNVLANNKGDGLSFKGATVNEPNSFGENKAIGNGGNGIIVIGKNADLNFDDGGNVGLANAGATQCQIGPDPCQ